METKQTRSKKMVRLTEQIRDAVSALVALCRAKKLAAKRRITMKTTDHHREPANHITTNNNSSLKVAPRSPLITSSKQLLSTLSDKAMALAQKRGHSGCSKEEKARRRYEEEESKDFGDGGLWQRAILMGEKCQPPDFSGVIYYDSNGKQLSEMPPRSPRSTPLHNIMVSVPVGKN